MSSLLTKIKDHVSGSTIPPGHHLAALSHSKGTPLSIEARPTPTPGPNDLLIEVKSIALNPIDGYMRDAGFAISSYPAVPGSDIAGYVLSAGSSVPPTAPKPGTRVAAFAPAFFVQGAPDYGALQTRVLVPAANAVPLPERVGFNEAALLPMAVTTAWSGWYSIGVPRETAHGRQEGLLVWGGASSVGSAAVQTARILGFRVYATASEKHHAYLKTTLGAARVFDYRGENVVSDIVKAVKEDGVTLRTAFDAVGALQYSTEVLKELKGDGQAKLASAVPLREDSPRPEGVEVKFVAAPLDEKELTEHFHFVFNVWLKEKLETGEYVPSPGIKVVEGGLNSVNEALDELKQGVSGVKLVLEV